MAEIETATGVTTQDSVRSMPAEPTQDVLDEMAEFADEMAALSDTEAQRAADLDPSIPVGTVVHEGEIQGMPIRHTKRSSMIRMGNTPMPARTQVFARPGNIPSMVATTLLQTKLGIRNRNGDRILSRKKWPNEPEPEYFEKEIPNAVGAPYLKRFPDELVYEQFMSAWHPAAWARIQRLEETRRHDESIAAQLAQGEAIRLNGEATLKAVEAMAAPAEPAKRGPGRPRKEPVNE